MTPPAQGMSVLGNGWGGGAESPHTRPLSARARPARQLLAPVSITHAPIDSGSQRRRGGGGTLVKQQWILLPRGGPCRGS